MNTIYDVIERFSLNRETVILGLSNLAFDLSVFDIFGCFQVGGTLVLPDDELKKNPKTYFRFNYYKSCDCIKCSSCSNENAGFLYG